MGDRRSAREAALQILFQKDFNEDSPIPYSLVKISPDARGADFSSHIVAGVLQYRADIDKRIKEHAENWAADRMAVVDLNILRIAIFEMVYGKETLAGHVAPAKVVINEAIEIAKKYGNENSGAFVNGILDTIHHALPQDVGWVSKR